MRFLAADELLGRRTGEQGNRVAARYIAEQFRKLGVKPVLRADSSSTLKYATNSYYQNISFEKTGINEPGEIIADAEILRACLGIMFGKWDNFSAT